MGCVEKPKWSCGVLKSGQPAGASRCTARTRCPSAVGVSRVDLAECIYQSVAESQFPHIIVNLFFTNTSSNIQLIVFVGELTLQN